MTGFDDGQGARRFALDQREKDMRPVAVFMVDGMFRKIGSRNGWKALTPFCLSSGDSRGVDFLAALRDEREDLSGEVALQGSNGVEFGMPFCYPTSNVVLGSLVGPQATDGDDV